MSLVERLRYRWSCIIVYAASKAKEIPEREGETVDERLERMEREAFEECMTTLFDGLPLDGGADEE